MNLLFYATPILYTADLLPGIFQWIIKLNPLAQMITAYRDIFMYHIMPGTWGTLYIILISAFSFVIGLIVFRKLERGFAEEV